MARRKGGEVSPYSEIHKRFRRKGVAAQIMATLRYANKTPEQLIIALGINRWDNRAKATQQKELCKQMDALIERRSLPITKTSSNPPKYARSDRHCSEARAS